MKKPNSKKITNETKKNNQNKTKEHCAFRICFFASCLFIGFDLLFGFAFAFSFFLKVFPVDSLTVSPGSGKHHVGHAFGHVFELLVQ